jgi:Tol biopolymer transport system component
MDLGWSPDNTQIVFTGQNPVEDWSHLYRVNIDQPDIPPRQLTQDIEQRSYGAVWSPDGKKLAYVVHDPGYGYLTVLDLISQKIKVLTTSRFDDIAAIAWSPDMSRIAFSAREILYNASSSYMSSNVYLIDGDGTNLQQIGPHSFHEVSPAWRSQPGNAP